uniref:Uncharacterized protein n=1 Tax=Rhizophora mucronata TaxID=61149 RepID=A0A2P2PNW6_RHIMU
MERKNHRFNSVGKHQILKTKQLIRPRSTWSTY